MEQQKLKQRDQSIDFIKGIAIFAVIIHHALTFSGVASTSDVQYILGHAVPIFLTITIYLNFKKYSHNPNSPINITRLTKKILFPFLLSQLFAIPIALKYGIPYKSIILSFGFGAGTYYILIYLQIVCLCKPVFWGISRKIKVSFLALLLIHLISEFLFRYFEVPEYIYRLICTRYLFLFFIAYLLLHKDLLFKYRNHLVCFAVIGLILQYINCKYNNHIWLYPSEGFVSQKFYTNFITLFIIIILYKIYNHFPSKFIAYCGRMSNYLFIAQLTFFPTILYLINMILGKWLQ